MGEPHRKVGDYVRRFSDAVLSQEGSSLSPLLAVSSSSSPLLLSVANPLAAAQDWGILLKQVDAQLREILAHLLRAIHSFRSGRFVEVYNAFERSAIAFLQEFCNWESAWALDPLYTIAYEIRILVEKADWAIFAWKKPREAQSSRFLLDEGVWSSCEQRTKAFWRFICDLPVIQNIL